MDKNIYPIGQFEYGKSYSDSDTQQHIQQLEVFPKQLKAITAELLPAHFSKSYRPSGWNARQIIHHLADSHLNAYMRIKLSITEDKPVIKPYNQDLWANLPDSQELPIDCSLELIEMLHFRMVYLLKSLDKEMLQRSYIHPEYNREFKLDELVALYAWHGKHHAGHLTLIINS